jgi:hypothetical protein
MKSTHISNSIKAAVLVTAVSCAANLRAVTNLSVQPLDGVTVGQNQLETVAFSDTKEAHMLHEAYRMICHGDHDYNGHRVEAMHHLDKAAEYLGEDLAGDRNAHETQALSDDKMKYAQELIIKVRDAATVKDQPRIRKELNLAIKQINLALGTK